MDRVTIEGGQVRVASPEGRVAALSVEALFARLAPREMDTGGIVLPDGVKAVISAGPVTIWVHQTPPRVHAFRWIAADSPRRFGDGTRYREVRIALPYVIVLAVFVRDQSGRRQLGHQNECFFRNEPLRSLTDELSFPALLNCSKFEPAEQRPLSWICTQHLNLKEIAGIDDGNTRLRRGLTELLRCLFETGFNYSSEHHEESSWFTESAGCDPRIATVENWEAATRTDPLFVLEIPWLSVGASVEGIAERILRNLHAAREPVRTAAQLARIVINHGTLNPGGGDS
jgi:hypothetical protein